MTRIIGLLGGAGAGKSTVAKYLRDSYNAKIYTLAKPLKEFVGRVFDLTPEQLYGTQEQKETIDPRYGVSPRWLLQRIGTQGFRESFGEDYWVNLCLKNIFEDNHPLAVIDDCRFGNEALHIRDAGGVVWRLNSTKRFSDADPNHQSEAEWVTAPYDDRIAHDGENLAVLLAKVDALCRLRGLT